MKNLTKLNSLASAEEFPCGFSFKMFKTFIPKRERFRKPLNRITQLLTQIQLSNYKISA